MDTAPLRSLLLRSIRRCALGVIGLAALASSPLPAVSGVALAQAVPPAVTFAQGAAPSADVDGIYQRFRAAYRALDLDAAANLYAEDALYLAPDSEIVRGRPAIRKVFEGFFAAVKQRGGQLDITFQVVDRRSAGGVTYDVGIYTLKTTGHNGEVNSFPGKFVTVARKGPDGVWRFQLDSYSSITPIGKKAN
ncbi:MAG: SgcJ/EcaC family oxidoreductase [Polyangia bacterium]